MNRNIDTITAKLATVAPSIATCAYRKHGAIWFRAAATVNGQAIEALSDGIHARTVNPKLAMWFLREACLRLTDSVPASLHPQLAGAIRCLDSMRA